MFANYMLKFFEEYKKQGVEFWGLTTGNEPINGFRKTLVNCMGWTNLEHVRILVNFYPLIEFIFTVFYLTDLTSTVDCIKKEI